MGINNMINKESKLIYFFNDSKMEDVVLTLDNVHTSAELFTHDFLQKFETSMSDVKYNITRNASFKDRGRELDNADIGMDLIFRSMSGVKLLASCNIMIRRGMFVEPSIMKLNGSTRLISQDTFDEIESLITFQHPVRNLFSIFPTEETTYPYVTNNGDFWRA